MVAMGSPYGAGAPSYDSVQLQRENLAGRLEVAIGIRDRAAARGDERRRATWAGIVDELLDRLGEVRGIAL